MKRTIKNLKQLLQIPRYQGGGESGEEILLERTLPAIEVYGDQLRRDMARTGLTADQLANLNYGALRLALIQGDRKAQSTELLGFTPVVGDAMAVYDIGKDIRDQLYARAAIGAGLMLLPNFIEKPVRWAYRKGRQFFKWMDAPNRLKRVSDYLYDKGTEVDRASQVARQKAYEADQLRRSLLPVAEHAWSRLADVDKLFLDVPYISDAIDPRWYPVYSRKLNANIDKMSRQDFYDWLLKNNYDAKEVKKFLDLNLKMDDAGRFYIDTTSITDPYQQKILDSLKLDSETFPVFRTGETVSPKINVSRTTDEATARYYIGEEKVVPSDNVSGSSSILIDVPTEYTDALKDNISFVKERFPGFSPFGSSVGVTEAGFPHITGDIDGYISAVNFENQVLPKVRRLNVLAIRFDKSGKTDTFNVDINDGKYGHQGTVDFNIVYSDTNGNAIGTNAEELFRQFFPEDYERALKEMIDNGGRGRIKINKSPQELIDAADPSVKTILDSFEINFNGAPTKGKHAGRTMAYMSYSDPSKVREGLRSFGRSVLGNNVLFAHQFPTEMLSDVSRNKAILEMIDFPGDVNAIARDPLKMLNALDYWYLNATTRSRYSSAYNYNTGTAASMDLDLGFRLWNYSGQGGTANGAGLNTVVFGDSGWGGDAYGHIQAVPKKSLNTNSPEEFIESVERFIGDASYKFTEAEKNTIVDIINRHGIYLKKGRGIRNINNPQDLLNALPSSGKGVKDALQEISDELDIAYVTKTSSFGDSNYSSVIRDVTDKDNVQYFDNRSRAPIISSLKSRRSKLKSEELSVEDAKVREMRSKVRIAKSRRGNDIKEADKQFGNKLLAQKKLREAYTAYNKAKREYVDLQLDPTASEDMLNAASRKMRLYSPAAEAYRRFKSYKMNYLKNKKYSRDFEKLNEQARKIYKKQEKMFDKYIAAKRKKENVKEAATVIGLTAAVAGLPIAMVSRVKKAKKEIEERRRQREDN